jgi:predicted kinase
MAGTQSRTSQQAEDVARLRASLPEIPTPVAKPVMVMVSGLPGSGKSYFARRLVAQEPLLVLESDVFRKTLFPSPVYTAAESERLFRACHSLIDQLLKEGVPVLLDATNLVEAHRERLYHIADRIGARLVLIHLKAPPEVIQERLKGRVEGVDPEDNSSADWQVYQKMYSTAEPIKRSHFVVDTSRDISPAISKVVREVRRGMRVG